MTPAKGLVANGLVTAIVATLTATVSLAAPGSTAGSPTESKLSQVLQQLAAINGGVVISQIPTAPEKLAVLPPQ